MYALDPFIRKFGGRQNPSTGIWSLPDSYLSLLNSSTYIGFAFGLVTGNILSGKFGRMTCFLVMCTWAEIGGIILITSQYRWQMVVGRIVAYVYIGMELALVPVLQSELTPAPVHGFIVGTYQSSLALGSLIGALSPRWLLSKGREEEAMHSLRLLREGRYNEEEIEAEFREFKSMLNRTVEKGRFADLIRGANLKRTLIVIGVNIFLQLTGQNFAILYGSVFIKSTGAVDPFAMTSINAGIGIVAVHLWQFHTDKTGSKPLMLLGAILQTCALFTMGGLGTPAAPTLGMRTGIIAVLSIFTFSFSLGWAPLSHVVSAEIPAQHLRDKTYAIGAVFNITIQFAVSFSIPYFINAEM
ncbi:MFS general substrate transporter [Bimuria novae-zelandiae CBS 107.79]|uniref:MFS general substrate transporter n=1 Tax=Bimuria novae-zelandiae CBS 107.79 TaxID=1447943 RepID=A0A6A5UZW1_9PLEO|nr:MFS general substrate transporter [Bimuria novae-zelandiae CBS 107.79]